MAEQEVIKHVKKTWKIWSSRDHSFWHKLREFMIEVLIIVFAITLSIWLHERSEHKHQQKDVQVFLLGLKADLQQDIIEMNEDKESFEQQGRAFYFIASSKRNLPLNSDTLSKYQGWLFNTTGLVPNNGRFEGFKSSGKIGNIENPILQNEIMNLYQEGIPSLLVSTSEYRTRKNEFFKFVNQNQKRLTDSTTDLANILSGDIANNIANSLYFINEIQMRYDICINQSKRIIDLIDQIHH